MAERTPFSFRPGVNVTVIRGDVASGKSHGLLDNLARALENDSNADCLVFSATPIARDVLRKRAIERFGDGLIRNVRFAVPWEVALDVIADLRETPYLGNPRIVDATDMVFLMEDMKSLGLKPVRLREMLKFFYRTWSMMEDDDSSWLMEGEEAHVYEHLRHQLDFRGALISDEVSNRAVRLIQDSPESEDAYAHDHVFVDDAQLLSRASQIFACILAKKTLFVTGNEEASFEAFEPYPYAYGMDEIIKAAPHATVSELSGQYQSAEALAASEAIRNQYLLNDAEAASCECRSEWIEADDPGYEISSVAEKIFAMVRAGVDPASIVVASPNAIWNKNMIRALKSYDIPCETVIVRKRALGDVKDKKKCAEAMFITALDLIADPADSLAWRAWCGYGDNLTNSVAMSALMKYAQGKSMDLSEVLSYVNEYASELPSAIGMNDVIDAYLKGLDLISGAEGLAGNELIQYVVSTLRMHGVSDASWIERLLPDANWDRDATSEMLSNKIHDALLFPTLPSNSKGSVIVVTYASTVGLVPEYLFSTGLVNGLIPPRKALDDSILTQEKQEKVIEEQARMLMSVFGKPSSSLVLSWFEFCSPENAKKLDLKVERIMMRDGKRSCRISKSIYVDTLLNCHS